MTDPRTVPEIATALRAVHDESVAYWRTFSTPDFLAPIGTAWSPADNVRHLTKSVRPVSAGLRLPRWVLRLAFGRVTGVSRSYAESREMYRARLAEGVSAGRFSPSARPPAADPEAERARVMTYHAAAIDEMVRIVGRWPEDALDRIRLPHPALGRLTVREMLFFTVYHNRHHVEVVRGRWATRSAAQ